MHHLVFEKLLITPNQSTVVRAASNSARVEIVVMSLKTSDQASHEEWPTTEGVDADSNCESHEGLVAARGAGEGN